ncbi:MAG: RNA pseudouridine synthase [Treponema sp.]|nr:RNA pseudouridine synthase [Treponema sp.]
MKRIDILYEDSFCMVLNKPSGLAVQGGRGVAVSLDSILAEEFRPRPLLVHRLDRDTSGCILVAKNREAAAFFSRLFGGEKPSGTGGRPSGGQGRGGAGLVKQYLAVCAGRPPDESGVIRLELEIRGRGKKSETRYRRLSGGPLPGAAPRAGEYSLLEIEPGTGRMHQIRRHLAQTGIPVLGDDKYGNFRLNRELRGAMNLRRLLLHAFRLVIPALGDFPGLSAAAPLPGYFQPFCESPDRKISSLCYSG